MSLAVHAKGTLLQVEEVTPDVFTTIAEVKSIAGPNLQGATIDVTTHSTAGNYREFKANIIDPGALDFDVNYVGGDTKHKQLLADIGNQTEREYKLVTKDLPAASVSFRMTCQVTGMNFNFPVDNVQTARVTLKIINPPALPISLEAGVREGAAPTPVAALPGMAPTPVAAD
jgi:predicted secreted protein